MNIGKIGNYQPCKLFLNHYLNKLDNNQKNIEAVLIFFYMFKNNI